MTIMECICELLGSLFMNNQIGLLIGVQENVVFAFIIVLSGFEVFRLSME